MRITGGEYRGRVIKSAQDDSIRPTTDKVRQSIFNMIVSRHDIQDYVVLDLFCGTGSLGLEAISRGASYAYFIDISKSSLRILKENISTLQVQDKTKVMNHNALRMDKIALEKKIDIVFMDPPFSKGFEEDALKHMTGLKYLTPDTLIIVETDRADFKIPDYFVRHIYKDYGRSKIHFLHIKDI